MVRRSWLASRRLFTRAPTTLYCKRLGTDAVKTGSLSVAFCICSSFFLFSFLFSTKTCIRRNWTVLWSIASHSASKCATVYVIGPRSARMPGRLPGGEVFSRLGASFISSSTSSSSCLSTTSLEGPALWWEASARRIAIDCRSCHRHEGHPPECSHYRSKGGCKWRSTCVFKHTG